MNKLLSANFTRLWRNKVFWAELAAMFVWGALILIFGYRGALERPEIVYTLDIYFFQFAPVIGGFCAVFTSLFIGTDYSDGTIRNKIVVGHSRASIYLSNLVVSFSAGIAVFIAWFLAMLCIGMPLFGALPFGAPAIAFFMLVTVLMVAAFAAIYTLICMLNQSKAGVAIITLLVFIALILVGSYCFSRLNEPEIYNPGIVVTEEGGVEQRPTEPNPNYVSGNTRKAFELIVDFLPTGQGIQISEGGLTRPQWLPVYSLVIILLTTAAGIFFFCKKDLK